MWIADSIYLTFYSINSAIPAIFFFVIAVFLLKIQNRAKSSFFLGIAFLFFAILTFCYTASSSIYLPQARYIRFISGVIPIPIGMYFILFLINYPEPLERKWNIAISLLGWMITGFIWYYYYILLSSSSSFFEFSGHYWEYHAIELYRLISIIILLLVALLFFLGIWKMFISSKRNRKIFLGFIFALMLISVFPAIANFFSYESIIDRSTYLIVFNMASLLGSALFVFLYLQNTLEKSSYVNKITGLILLFTFLLIEVISFFEVKEREDSFDKLAAKDQWIALATENEPPHLEYILEFFVFQNQLQYAVGSDLSSANMQLEPIRQDLLYSYYYFLLEEISEYASRDQFITEATIKLQEAEPFFTPYKKHILKFLYSLSPDEKNIPIHLKKYLQSLEIELAPFRKRVRSFSKQSFRPKMEQLLQFEIAEIKFFQQEIKTYLKTHTEASLRKDVQKILHPLVLDSYKRRYRTKISDNTHYISYIKADTASGKAFETGYNYIFYRNYIHYTVKKFMILLFIVLFFCLYMIRFFLQSTLIAPLEKLAMGMAHVEKGDFQYRIELNSKNEFGFLSEIYNRMTYNLLTFDARSKRETNILKKRFIDSTQIISKQARKLSEVENVLEQKYESIFSFYASLNRFRKITSISLELEDRFFDKTNFQSGFYGRELNNQKKQYFFFIFINPFNRLFDQIIIHSEILITFKSQLKILSLSRNISIPQAMQTLYAGIRENLQGQKSFSKIGDFILGALCMNSGLFYYINQNMSATVFYKNKDFCQNEKEVVLSQKFFLSGTDFAFVNSFILTANTPLFLLSVPGAIRKPDPYTLMHYIRVSRGDLSTIGEQFQQQKLSGFLVKMSHNGEKQPELLENQMQFQQFLNQEEYAEAMQQAELLLQDYPDYPEFLYGHAFCCRKQNQLTKALESAKQLYRIQPSLAKNTLQLAEILVELDSPNEAKIVLEKLIAQHPDHQQAREFFSQLNS